MQSIELGNVLLKFSYNIGIQSHAVIKVAMVVDIKNDENIVVNLVS